MGYNDIKETDRKFWWKKKRAQQQQQQQQRESYFKEVEWEEKELKIRLLGTRMGRDRTEN